MPDMPKPEDGHREKFAPKENDGGGPSNLLQRMSALKITK